MNLLNEYPSVVCFRILRYGPRDDDVLACGRRDTLAPWSVTGPSLNICCHGEGVAFITHLDDHRKVEPPTS